MELGKSAAGHEIRVGGARWATFVIDSVGDVSPTVQVSDAGEGWQHVRLTWNLGAPVVQDEVAVTFRLDMTPDLWWAPHLTPREGTCIAQHVFRSPALVACEGSKTLALIPDLELCGAQSQDTVPMGYFHPIEGVGARQLANPWFMDVDAPNKTWELGVSLAKVTSHVEFEKAPGLLLEPGTFSLGFFVSAYVDPEVPRNPWGRAAGFLWERYGHSLFETGQPLTIPMDRYVGHVYNWAFKTWEDAVWQEFDLDGKRVGSPAFIVNVTESPNYPGDVNLREFLSIWNQAWFSSLRGASGLFRYARRTGNADLARRAELTKAFALAAPIKDGIFPGVYRTEMTEVEVDGKRLQRSKGWETGYWTNSNRSPREQGITDAWYHILDASWTALLMLRWYQELDADPALLSYAQTYAEKLLSLQDVDGFFPAWLNPDTLEPADALAQSPETSMSVTFLLKLAALTGDERYRMAALRAMDAVLAGIVPTGRWEDFETYWSCSSYGKVEFLGRQIPRSGMYKQCNFSMFWTAEALLDAYRTTGDERYLKWGRRTLDELSMTQQVWQPPFIYIPALGGFGVMNYDGEWNDERQCLYAELFLEYYREMGDSQLFERGIAALKASFAMMYCPENPEARELWEKVWPFFGPEDYGFTMENYGHLGFTSREGGGIGEFTIYDWGNGAAAEARNRVWDHFGDVYVDRSRGQAFGIDSVAVDLQHNVLMLTDQSGLDRDVRVVYDNGDTRDIHLSGSSTVRLD